MRSRFEPGESGGDNEEPSSRLIDPEAYDASEQQFAASLEQAAPGRRPKFIVEDPTTEESPHEDSSPKLPSHENALREADSVALESVPQEPADGDAWRREVAARLSRYRARRRTREPRYPSLQLKFESHPVWDFPARPTETPGEVSPARDGADMPAPAPRIRLAEAPAPPRILPAITSEATAKVIDFASYSPPRPLDELAEPVLDRPRIMEAPESTPPPPALGGILIEPDEAPASERRPGFEIPLQTAPVARRAVAVAIDGIFVLAALAGFGYIFFRITAEMPPPWKVAGFAAPLLVLLWAAYQSLLLVFSSSTPGLRLARLELQRFDGSPAPRRLRGWRVLASVLSGASLGLGYAWCMLDEDQLCWHDRITRTYMAPRR